MHNDEPPQNERFFKEWEEYWKRRDKEWKRVYIFIIGATIGAVIAAIGFLLEIFGIWKEPGLVLGVLGIMVTVICSFWGALLIVEGIKRGMREGHTLILRRIELAGQLIRTEGDQIRQAIETEADRIISKIMETEGGK